MALEEIHLQNLHYFFSTAPQVLGALLAITGAFVVLKLDILKRALFSGSQGLIDKEEKYSQMSKIFSRSTMSILRTRQIAGDVFGVYSIANIAIPLVQKLKHENQVAIDQHKARYETEETELINSTQLVAMRDREIQLDYIAGKCYFIKSNYEKYKKFTKNTILNYIINGILLGILLVFFLFLPQFTCGIAYWIVLSVGLAISISSLIIIVTYLIKSIDINSGKDSIISN